MVYDTAIKMSNAMASPTTYENISTPKAMLTTGTQSNKACRQSCNPLSD